MGSKLRKNAIMTGYINSYCLVCECYFDTDEETSKHILDIGHINKLLAYPYFEKYGDNHIRKVNKGYFCEFCSVLLATPAKVSLHVQEKTHYERKGTFLLRRPSGQSAVIAFDNLLISERAWHSLSEDTCAICNEEFDNENIHKTESAHLLKLVQNKVEFGPENSLYRKTDDSSFQCMTCNAVFAINMLNEHFTNTEHKKLYVKCQEGFKKFSEQSKSKAAEKPKDDVKNKNDDIKDKKDEVKDKKDDVQDKKDDVSGKKDDAQDEKDDVRVKKDYVQDKKDDVKGKKEDVDKKENEKTAATPVETNQNTIKDSNASMEIEIKSQNCGCAGIIAKTVPTKSEPDEATVYANGNNLTYNTGNSNAFCRICETKLPATLRSMKEHVNGKEHKNRLGRMASITQAAKTKTNITKKPTSKFIEFCVNIDNVFHHDVVINEKYCIPQLSFVLISKLGGRFRCQLCEVTLFEDDLGEHTDQARHERNIHATPVVTSLPDEFVREPRPGIYHCGYCNLIVPRWEEVASHLQSREHRDNKDECLWRLHRHLPSLLELRRQQKMEVFHSIMMGHMFRR